MHTFCTAEFCGLYAQQDGQVAQLVEQRTENPRVGGSIPSLATIPFDPNSDMAPHPKTVLRQATSRASTTWGQVQVQGVPLIYRVVGRGRPLVLLHGLAGSSRWWSRNVRALAREHRL